ncbi:hypothetical protein DFH06DRAFT_1015216 [Mycena polygramma]|nr:hypothetical protein DFH06DRAFT_1019530 [Mycena polygramma]KAJ7612508.1 hypothetical protein DFH06DRAFT_1015216 [Mycena polygramma]
MASDATNINASTLPAELLDLIVEFALQPPHSADTTSPSLFTAIAPFTLACSQFRSLALRRFFRHVIFSETEYGKGNSQWNRFFQLLDALHQKTGGECFTWVRSLRASSKTLMGRFHSARLAALTHLEELSVDLATEGFVTQKPFLQIINNASHQLTMLTLTSLPCIDLPLLRLIADFPFLVDLYLSCTERLEFHCWSCFEESLGRTTHSPIPCMFSDSRSMAIVFAKILKPLTCLVHLHLGIYLSDEMLLQYHVDHAEPVERDPFGPELCLLCDAAASDVQLRELAAGLELAQSLKALRTVGFSSVAPGNYARFRNTRNGDGEENETTVYVLRENGRIKVRKSPW